MTLLFQDIIESKTFRSPSSFQRYSMKQMCEITYLYLLVLCLFLSLDFEVAKSYAKTTMNYPEFDGLRFSNTDLGNLITGITHAERYFELKGKVLPLLQIKRMFREIKNGHVDRIRLRSLMTKLQKALDVTDSTYSRFRRDIVDFDLSLPNDQRRIADELYHVLIRKEARGDIVLALHNYLISK